jgi:hypothetical protein
MPAVASRQCREGQEFESPRAYHFEGEAINASRLHFAK